MDQSEAVIRDKIMRIEITTELFDSALRVDPAIEPKCIFWDEYENHDRASILAEIIETGVEIVSGGPSEDWPLPPTPGPVLVGADGSPVPPPKARTHAANC